MTRPETIDPDDSAGDGRWSEAPDRLFERTDIRQGSSPRRSANDLERVAREGRGGGWAEDMAFTPLLTLPGFRKIVDRVLDDRTVIGKCWVDRSGNVSTRRAESTSVNGGDEKVLGDSRRPKSNEVRPFRICDQMAQRLADLKGAPEIRLYWPVTDKDAAITRLRLYLQRNADRMTDLIAWPYNWRESALGDGGVSS